MTQQPQPLTLSQDGVVAGSTGSTSICGKDFRERTLRSLKLSLGKLWKRRSVTITEYDPTYKVAYLGNVLTGWAKGEGCVEKPLSTLWKNYTGSSKPDVPMKVTVTQAGLKAVTKEHGLTEYWSHRITYCAAPASFPRIFCWVYRHEGRKLKQELRCHAVLCSKEAVARRMASQLKAKLAQSLSEFKRDKVCRQNARLSLVNSVYDNPSLPRRKILLSTGSHNYRPPLERSKSAPKLMVIEESLEEGEEEYLDLSRDHTNRPQRDASIFSRLEEISGEEKCLEYPSVAEGVSQWCHDNNDEGERSDGPRSRGILRLQGDRYVADEERHCTSLREGSQVASVTSGDNELRNLESNGSSVYRFDKNQENALGREMAASHALLRFRGSETEFKRRVGWKLETASASENVDSLDRNVSNFHTERLLVTGSCRDGDVRQCVPSSGGVGAGEEVVNSQKECESDEGSNSLQSISSSTSSSSDSSCRFASSLKRFAPCAYEDIDIETPEDGVEVDLHPTHGPFTRREPVSVDLDHLSTQLRRSATFPPPSAVGCANRGEISELDSLSEEDDMTETPGEHEEEEESDESGYAELTDAGVKELGEGIISADMKETDVPQHQLMKTFVRGNSRSSQCLQV